jgi:hypothetical protein
MRQQLMKMRSIMQTNALRGLLYEFGVVLAVTGAFETCSVL